jgi:hypothetical protein
MPRSSKEDEVKEKVLAYLKTAEVGDPSAFPIDVRNVSRRLQYSPTTIYKYHLDDEINASRERQANNNRQAQKVEKHQREQNRILVLTRDLEEQQNIDKGLVARIALVEHNAARLGIDPEELFKLMAKPIRSASRAGQRKGSRKGRR